MTLEEIKIEQEKLLSLYTLEGDNWKRLEHLRKEKERMLKHIHFHFESNVTVSQIQLFAKVFKCFINGPYVLEERHLNQLLLPVECEDVERLKKIARLGSFYDLFFITTPSYECLEYSTRFNKQIPDMRVSLDLKSLQEDFQHIRELSSCQDIYALIDGMINSYTLSNSAIGHNLFFEDYDLGGYRFHDKVAPNITYVDVMRRLRSSISLVGEFCDNKNFKTYAKYQILDFAYQCRYLSFWSCLVDVLSFPGLSNEESLILNNVAGWLLNNLTNPYLYHITCESNELNEKKNVNSRESSDNTTRIKIYLTRRDDAPMLVRFDLPHKGEPYVHLNIEHGNKNEHFRLSQDVEDSRFDHVFDNLCESLRYFNFNGSFFYHSPVAKDREIIRRMPEYTAMMNLASYMEGLDMDINFSDLSLDVIKILCQSIEKIRGIVKNEIGDTDSMSLQEIYMYADMILEKELNEQ